MLVFKAILRCDGPDDFGVPSCRASTDVEASVNEQLEIDSVPSLADVVTFTPPAGWTTRWKRWYCPKCGPRKH